MMISFAPTTSLLFLGLVLGRLLQIAHPFSPVLHCMPQYRWLVEPCNKPMVSTSSLFVQHKPAPIFAGEQPPDILSYLSHVLKLSDDNLSLFVKNYPQLLSLHVDTKVAPLINVLKSVGLKTAHIRKIVSTVPTVFHFDHRETLPLRLQALRQMFGLSRQDFVYVLTQNPFVLTSSTERNQEIANFFRNEANFSAEELRQLVKKRPSVLGISLVTIERCYTVLHVNYCFSHAELKEFVMKNPMVLSEQLLVDVDVRFRFLRRTIGLQLPPSRDFYTFVKKNVYLLLLPPVTRLSKCFCVLRDELQMSTVQTARFVRNYPTILTYRPDVLQQKCRQLLRFLCKFEDGSSVLLDSNSQSVLGVGFDGEEGGEVRSNRFVQRIRERQASLISIAEEEGLITDSHGLELRTGEGIVSDQYFSVQEVAAEEGDSHSLRSQFVGVSDFLHDSVHYFNHNLSSATAYLSAKQLLDHLYPGRNDPLGPPAPIDLPLDDERFQLLDVRQADADRIKLMTYFYKHVEHLSIPHDRCLRMVEQNPTLLGFQLDRYRMALGSIAFSLGMSKPEMIRIICNYPRVLMQSLDKLVTLFAMISKIVLRFLEIHGIPDQFASRSTDMASVVDLDIAQKLDLNPTVIASWVSQPVRAMTRDLVLRHPLLFGTSVARIEERVESFFRENESWKGLPQMIKRNPAAQQKWEEKRRERERERETQSTKSFTAPMKIKIKVLKERFPVFTLKDLCGARSKLYRKNGFLRELMPTLLEQVNTLTQQLDAELKSKRMVFQLPEKVGKDVAGDFLMQRIARLEDILDRAVSSDCTIEEAAAILDAGRSDPVQY